MNFRANADAFTTALSGLATSNPNVCTLGTLSQKATESGRDINYLRIQPPGGVASRPVVLILGGVHARELAPPPATLSFAHKLIKAYRSGSDAVDIAYDAFTDPDGNVPYGAWKILASEVRRFLDELTILVVPLVNPDGRDFVLVGNPDWRGNRNTAACAGFGVDINRNFPIGWHTDVYYTKHDQDIVKQIHSPDCSEIFRGPDASSEKETKGIQDLIDNNDVRFFIDVHSAGRRVLRPWGLADNQDTVPEQRFDNTALDRVGDTGGRDVLSGVYKEFMPNDPPDKVFDTHEQVALKMAQAIVDQAGPNAVATQRSTYRVRRIPQLYQEFFALPHILPVPGSTIDYALARQFRAGEPKPAYAFAMEIGWDPIKSADGSLNQNIPNNDPVTEGGFFPLNDDKFTKIERETHAGLAALLTAAVGPAAVSPPGAARRKKKK